MKKNKEEIKDLDKVETIELIGKEWALKRLSKWQL
jgi:cell division protein FtsX